MDAKYGGCGIAQSDIWPRDPATQAKKDDCCQCFELGYVWAVEPKGIAAPMGELGSRLLVLVTRIRWVGISWPDVVCEEGMWSDGE